MKEFTINELHALKRLVNEKAVDTILCCPTTVFTEGDKQELARFKLILQKIDHNILELNGKRGCKDEKDTGAHKQD